MVEKGKNNGFFRQVKSQQTRKITGKHDSTIILIYIWCDCDNDDEYAERIENAAKQIRGFPGKPKRISVAALGKYSGIPKLYRILASGRLPKTQAAVENYAETLEQWQHRKIRWAIRQMCERSEVITVYKIRHRATIEDPERKLDEFIAECITDSEWEQHNE